PWVAEPLAGAAANSDGVSRKKERFIDPTPYNRSIEAVLTPQGGRYNVVVRASIVLTALITPILR
ncbi:hypothetical protein, partial [Azospirillum brasilense]|uniref:hypothetical protein n=1 Tax=Azospirillum brasilense TaxID=192 RepID=UPI001B3C0B5F